MTNSSSFVESFLHFTTESSLSSKALPVQSGVAGHPERDHPGPGEMVSDMRDGLWFSQPGFRLWGRQEESGRPPGNAQLLPSLGEHRLWHNPLHRSESFSIYFFCDQFHLSKSFPVPLEASPLDNMERGRGLGCIVPNLQSTCLPKHTFILVCAEVGDL